MNYYNEIKSELINNEINRKVKNYSINKSDLNTYYNVGKILRFESTISGAIKVVLKNDFSDYISRRELKNVKRRMGLWKNTC